MKSFGPDRGAGLDFPRPGVHLDGVQRLWGNLAGCRKGLERGREEVLGMPRFHNEELICENFEAHWVDKGGGEEYARRGWFNGTDPGSDVAGGGIHWPGVNFAN